MRALRTAAAPRCRTALPGAPLHPACPCAKAAEQCTTPRVSVRHGRGALRHVPCVHAPRPRSNAPRPVCPCAKAVVQCTTPRVSMRQGRGAMHHALCVHAPRPWRNAPRRACPCAQAARTVTFLAVDGTSRRADAYLCHEVENLKTSGFCGFHRTDVLDSTSCFRAARGCAHTRKHQPEGSACGRDFQPVAASRLSTSRDVTAGLIADIRR
jgi:hypothetical protein